jgi:hypothetical protein
MVSLHGEHRELSAGTAVAPVSESAAAIAVIVLTILGLLNVVPGAMVAIATIVVGAAILLQGAQTATDFSRLVVADSSMSAASATWGGSITLEFLAGGVGIVLGILALFSQTPTLTPAALIVFGGTLLLIGSTMARVGSTASATSIRPEAAPQERATDVMVAQMSGIASGAQIMIGIAAIVLGILALVPIHGAILTLIGLLAVGASLLVSTVAGGGFTASMLHS